MNRYAKNIGTVGENGQQKLLAASAAIVGAGGLGGTVFEILVRAGVGRITIVDFDAFEATNLNRQLLSSERNLGESKVAAAVKRASEVNAAVRVIPTCERITDENAARILRDADVVCDCLGNIRDRFVVERAARGLRIPLVHAAVAGTSGQIMTVFPESAGIEAIYGDEASAPDAGEELRQGTPPATVMAVASLQAHEAIGVLLGKGTLKDAVLRVDLAAFSMKTLTLPAHRADVR